MCRLLAREAACAALAVLAIGFAAGCADDEPDAGEDPAAPEPPALPAPECPGVPRPLLDAIAEGLTVQGGGSLRNGKFVPSDDPPGFLIAADIQGPGLEGPGDIGVWAITGGLTLADLGLILAVDSVAREFSTWGEAAAEGSDAANLRDAYRASPAYEQARDCAE